MTSGAPIREERVQCFLGICVRFSEPVPEPFSGKPLITESGFLVVLNYYGTLLIDWTNGMNEGRKIRVIHIQQHSYTRI